ncbi:MAG: phosphatase PAP2 family protein [Telmatospirillum sp.]|nr:phosphatase PAP2 family protein [Telmatospirillum sp.]
MPESSETLTPRPFKRVASLFSVRCFVMALALLTGVTGVAAAASPDFLYLAPATVDLTVLLAPPPAPGSDGEAADLAAVIAASQGRTAAEAARAAADATTSALRFADAMGAGFTADNLPYALPFLDRAAHDTHALVSAAKVGFDRLRPQAVDARVAPLRSDGEPGPSSTRRSGAYPSGHAAFAYVTGILLAAMVPEKGAEIFARAADYSHNRLIAGAHFPTDIEAGRIAGTVIAGQLLRDPRFLADFGRARAEVRHALGYAVP